MAFEGENVVLAEDVIKKLRNFIPTESEWRGRTEEIIVRESGTTTTTTIFTVPKNKTLFITYAFVTAINSGSINGNGAAGLRISKFGGLDILNAGFFNLQESVATNAVNFTMPIKVDAGETVIIDAGVAGIKCSAGFMGWLESKTLK